MASRSIRPPLKHTPFTELLPDGTQFVTNSWYDWALNLQKAIDTLRVIVGDPDGDGVVDEGGIDDVNRLLAQEVTVFARDMLPTATGGCSALTVLEFGTGQPNVHALLFDPTTDESADFHVTLPFSWAGKAFKAYVYFTQETTATTYGVVWELAANCTGDDESIILDFETGSLITESRVTRPGKLYITALSDAIPISRQLNRDGDLCSLRLYRRPSNSSDNLDIDAALIAVRFVLADTLPDPTATDDEDPYIENVILLVQGGTDGGLTIEDKSIYASTATITNYAEFDDAHQVFGANSIKMSTQAAAVSAFSSSDPASRFGRLSGDVFTIECWIYVGVTENYAPSGLFFAWEDSANPILRIGIYAATPSAKLYYSSTAHIKDTAALSAGLHFLQFNLEADNTYTLDVDGVLVYSGTNSTGVNTAGTYKFFVASYVAAGSATAPTTQLWVSPLRMTKGISRARGSVPTLPFLTAEDTESGPAVSARWYESNAYTLISDRLAPTGLNCIANFSSATDQVGIAHVSSADGTNAQVTRTGKVFLEFPTGADYGNFIGVLANTGFTAGFPTTREPFGTAGYYCIHNIDYRTRSPGLITNGTASTNATYDWDPGDTIGMAIDWDTGKVWFHKNTIWLSGDPAAGTSPTFTLPSGAFTIVAGAYVLSGEIQVLDLRARSGTTLLLPPTGFDWYA